MVRMRDHAIYRDQDVLITTLNDDTLAGRVLYTSRGSLTLGQVAQMTPAGKAVPLAGVVVIQTAAVAWIQIHHQGQIGGER